MKRRTTRLLLLFIIFLCAFCQPVSAQEDSNSSTLDELYNEQLEASGAKELWNSLPPATRELLNKIGISQFDAESFTKLTPQTVMESFWSLLTEQAKGPLRSAGVLMGVILLYALMDGLKETVREESVSKVFGVICTLTACTALMVPLSGCIHNISKASESASVFMGSFVPVYAGVMLTNGQITSAASYQTIVLFAAELITLAATTLIVPLMNVSLALGLTGSLTPDTKLESAAGFLNKSCSWFLGLMTTVFVGMLTLQSVVGTAADSVAGRALKFSVSNFIPVVGSALGDALGTVRGCLGLLKSTLGVFGVLAIALIVLPPLLECILWMISLSFCGMVADIFSLGSVSSLFKTAQGVVKTLIGILSSFSLFLIVATTIVTVAGGGSS